MNRITLNALWILPSFVLLGCAGEPAEDREAGEAQTSETMEMAATAEEIQVENPMPHPMVVYASTNGDEVELGTVPANSSSYFTLTEPRGTMIQLRAEDEEQTHEVTGTVNLQAADEASWTIGSDPQQPYEGEGEAGGGR